MTSQDFKPDWASAPGDTIKDVLKERGLSMSEFAKCLGQTQEELQSIFEGRRTITLGLARELEQVLGASVEFWIARDFQYREDIVNLHAVEKSWLSELPLGEMIKFGWLPAPHPAEELNSCLQFFDLPTISAWNETYGDLKQKTWFKKSSSFDSRPAAVAAWLRQGEIEAETVHCRPWNPGSLKESLSHLRALSRQKKPESFVPELQSVCSQSGVAVVIVRAPAGCRASGATRFIAGHKAVLMLSFRYLTDDHFWFTFFHEVGHLLLHSKEKLFLEGTDAPTTTDESEANEFAALTLIPEEFQAAMSRLPVNGKSVIRFARRVGVAPGIVVGQLQHQGRLRHGLLNGLKRRFRWEDSTLFSRERP